MKRAYLLIQDTPHYRHDAFLHGLKRLGFTVSVDYPQAPMEKGDVALVWNRTYRSVPAVEKLGEGALIVCENGYYGKDRLGQQRMAMALDGHNGSGRWFVGSKDRLEDLNITFKPWRQDYSNLDVLIADQRGIGAPKMASPSGFGHEMRSYLDGLGYNAIVRPHPHSPEFHTVAAAPFMTQMGGCRALLVWGSNCSSEALIEGYPVFYRAPHIITQGATQRLSKETLEELKEPDRETAFWNLSWAQWTVEEIVNGDAIDTLLRVQSGELPSIQEGLGI